VTAALMRDYAPAHIIHEETCEEAPGLIAFRAQNLLEAYPTSTPHTCFSRDSVNNNRYVVAEPGEYERHDWQPSTLVLLDATRALCKICRGTHGELVSS
jgi:hypothetical protein